MTTIRSNLQRVHERIAAACAGAQRPVNEVTLLAVSKTFGPEAVREACRRASAPSARTTCRKRWRRSALLAATCALQWHCIGPMQSNKTRLVAANFDWAHTVDRLKIAQRLSEQRPEGMAPLQVCIQVNIDGGAEQGGRQPRRGAGARPGSGDGCRGITLRGLMTIPEPAVDFAAQKAVHLRAKALVRRVARGRAGDGHLVDGHDRRSRGGHRRGQHHGADRNRDLRWADVGLGGVIPDLIRDP